MSTAAVLLDIAGWYAWIGVAVAAVFLTIGIDRIDNDARGAYAFRPLLIPAVLLIWPLVLWRWYVAKTSAAHGSKRYSPPRASHGVAAVVMSGMIAATLIVGLAIRQTWPADVVPQQISGPVTGR